MLGASAEQGGDGEAEEGGAAAEEGGEGGGEAEAQRVGRRDGEHGGELGVDEALKGLRDRGEERVNGR